MIRVLGRRLLFGLFAVWAVGTIVFGLLYLSGDPVALILAGSFGTPEYVERLRRDLGLDLPVHQQYLRFLGQALHGDLGRSLRWNQPALPLVLERLPATFQLALAAIVLAVAVAVPAGVLAATRPRSLLSRGAMLLAFVGQSVPLFWLGIMLVLLVSVQLRWLPPGGRYGPESLILPAITLGLYPMARIARLTRSSMLEVLDEGYVVTARAKGLRESVVRYRHALKNAAIPIVTIVGLQLGAMLGGAVITETVFAWPGVGSLTIQAIYNRDLPLAQAAVMVVSVLFVAISIGVDVAYAYLDPRIRHD